MQISQDYQESRIRVNRIECAILEALPEEQEYTELVLALLNVAQKLQNTALQKEHPVLGKEKEWTGS